MCKNKRKLYIHNIKHKNLSTINYADLPESIRQRMQEQILLADAFDGTSKTSSVTNPSTLTPSAAGCGCTHSNGYGLILVIDVPCLAAGSPLKKMTSITIQSTLPHIVLQFGPDMHTANCPSICCAVDTCAALTTGNFHFFSTVAKHYLHCIAKILAPADYALIVLSGIVQNKDKAVTTKLKLVGFQFHLPYRTSGGNASSLLIAMGPHVLVNTIIGPRLNIPAGILRIPVFSVPVALFSQESLFLFRRNFFGTSSGNLSVWGLRRKLHRISIC